jgi:hypothetical protein
MTDPSGVRALTDGGPIYDTGNPWTDGYNMVVLGKTQTGKTSFGRELHDTSPRVSVWLNATGKDRVDDVPGVTVQSVDGVRRAFANDEYAIELVTADRQAALVELQEFMFRVADRTDRELMMQIVVDELQEVAPQSGKSFGNFPSRDAYRRFSKRGVKRNIKLVGLTQDPTAADAQSLRQAEYRVVFEMTHEARQSSVVRRMGFDWGAVDDGDRYTGTLFKDTGEVLERNVKAEARYA